MSEQPIPAPIFRPEATDEPITGKFYRSRRLAAALVGLWIFLIALSTMKEGAAHLGPILDSLHLADSLISTLGTGWLSAMLVMSGSPVALAGLSLYAGDSITQAEAFMSLAGSRMGVSFVILALAIFYTHRNRDPEKKKLARAGIIVGAATVILTTLVYLPGSLLGLMILESGKLDNVPSEAPFGLVNFIKMITDPVMQYITLLPTWSLFLVGVILLLLALRVIDLALPEMNARTLELEDREPNRWIIFGIGSVVALITMSVSVALTLLVPAIAKGYIGRRHAIPYILGANVTTLGDTLLASFLLGGGPVAVVVAELIGVSLLTVLCIGPLYRPLQRFILWLSPKISENDKLAFGMLAVGLIIPLVLIIAF